MIEGSTYAKEKTDKRYRTKIITEHDENGKHIFKYVSGTTKRELESNKAALHRQYIDGIESASKDMLFDVYVNEWYTAYRQPELSASSQRNYKSVLNKHVLPAFNKRQMRSIRAVELQTYLNGKKGNGETTITYIFAILTGAFRKAYIFYLNIVSLFHLLTSLFFYGGMWYNTVRTRATPDGSLVIQDNRLPCEGGGYRFMATIIINTATSIRKAISMSITPFRVVSAARRPRLGCIVLSMCLV